MVKITVNGEEHEVEKGKRLLLILSGKGVKIPHLCFHHALVPGASCKLCVVEVKEKNKPPKTRLSCAIKTREGLEITTESPDGCIRCRLCIRICKDIIGAKALKMVKREGMNYVIPSETGDCIGCGTCVNICPTDAIRSEDKGNVRTIIIRDEIIGRHPLERCEMCGRRFATTKFLKHVEELEESHPDTKEHHKLCPSCAKLHAVKDRGLLAPKLT